MYLFSIPYLSGPWFFSSQSLFPKKTNTLTKGGVSDAANSQVEPNIWKRRKKHKLGSILTLGRKRHQIHKRLARAQLTGTGSREEGARPFRLQPRSLPLAPPHGGTTESRSQEDFPNLAELNLEKEGLELKGNSFITDTVITGRMMLYPCITLYNLKSFLRMYLK